MNEGTVAGEETSWMGEAWGELFGDEPGFVADGQEVPVLGPGEASFELAEPYGPLTQISPHLQLQAAVGYRAGVMQLKDGMYLVTEIPEAALEPEFGVVALLAPLAMSMATKALENPETQQALIHAAGKGIQATGKGFKAVGKGVKQLIHPRRNSQDRRPKPPHPPVHAAPVQRPGQVQQPVRVQTPAVPVSPQGYYPAYPQGVPAAYPGGYPMPYPQGYPAMYPAPYPVAALPPGNAYPDWTED